MTTNPEHAVFHSAAIPGLEDYAIYPFRSKDEAEAWMIQIIRNYQAEYVTIADDDVIEEFQSSLDAMDYFHCYPMRKAPVG